MTTLQKETIRREMKAIRVRFFPFTSVPFVKLTQ